jgi:hypothetical protein
MAFSYALDQCPPFETVGACRRFTRRRLVMRFRTPAIFIALAVLLSVPGKAAADVVTNWNAVAEIVAPRFGGAQQQSRVQAMVQIAVTMRSMPSIRATNATPAWR